MSATHEPFESVEDLTRGEAGLDYAAAAVIRAEAERDTDSELPIALRGKLDADAEAFFTRPVIAGEIRRQRRMGFVGGFLAAASIALVLMVPLFSSNVRPLPSPPGGPSLTDVPWREMKPLRPTATGDFAGIAAGYEGVAGELRWDEDNQRGEMRFVGLPPNDPEAGQYQLWIVDPTRDDVPVDGGVFDVTPNADGVAVVAFEPRLPVEEAVLFAVTYEQPGGVVVSDGPLLVTAAPEAS
ncbi:MAG: anti-sigma factor [Planctomycetota bacterium]